MIFQAGDRFSVEGSYDNLNFGEIIDIVGEYYQVVWDHFPTRSFFYLKSDTVLWKWQAATKENKLPVGLGNVDLMNPGIVSTECQHEWKNYVGLSESFDFCVKCDVRKS